MAIVKMKRLTLLAMDADRDKIYDALIKCGSVQLKRSADIESCASVDVSAQREEVLAKIARVEEAIRYVGEVAQNFNAKHKRDKEAQVELPKGSFARPRREIDFDYFLSFGNNAQEIEQSLASLHQLRERISELSGQRAQKQAEWNKLSLYKALPHPPSWYHDTASSTVQLCQLPAGDVDKLFALQEQYPSVAWQVIEGNSSTALVVVVAHKSESSFFEDATALGLVKCNLMLDVLPRVAMEDIERQLNAIDEQIGESTQQIANFAQEIAQWKVYVDYLELTEKKLIADGDLQNTASTFVLEGFYPAETEEKVQHAICNVSDDIVLTFDEIADDEFAPTLTRNNKLVQKFESVTNSYTPPQYHEIDPNATMAVFYFIVFGLMMADIGYGLLLVIAGLFVTFVIKQNTGLKIMMQMFGICGVSAIVVGALFGSFFSYQLYDGLIPPPADYPMVMMVLSLMLGIVQIAAGIGCNMAVKIKNKHTLAAWLVDFPWIVTLATLLVAIFNMAIDMMAYEPYNALKLPDPIPSIALYVCLASLAVGVIFGGLGRKGILAKLMGSFGAAYGIINYFSDVMSYIRIFGLLLSSALIGSVVNQLGDMVIGNGGAGYIAAAILLIFAHLFNLAMGIMSIYIHNGRLQYVEFFGKFYAGDGQLFVPFGSDTRYTLVTNNPQMANTAKAENNKH